MEWLLEELVEKVAEYLTPQELAACCAVSVGWRDVFNQDSLWKPHCDKDTAQYLETAECRVQPGFVSPESEDSTLSPVCRWRLSYMRQNHLHNNWRRWKFVRDELKQDGGFQNAIYTFVSNDCLITSHKQEVTLWDVRKTPVRLGNPFCFLFESDYLLTCYMINNDTLMVLSCNRVEVYSCDTVQDGTWHLQYFFFANDELVHSPNELDAFNNVSNKRKRQFSNYCTIGNFFVYFPIQESNVFHVWDLQSGKLLKKEMCPESHELDEFIEIKYQLFRQEKQKSNMVVNVIYGHMARFTKNVNFFYVYSLKYLKFLPFKTSPDFTFSDINCVLLDSILAITDHDSAVYVYNYVTTQLIVKITANQGDIMAVASDILITKHEKIYALFNTKTLKLEILTVTNRNGGPLILSSGINLFHNFFLTCNERMEPRCWEAGIKYGSRIVTCIGGFRHIESYDINKSRSKLVFESSMFGKMGFHVLTFW